jgi:acetyltransferase-like isoleucine patch superfamily enzyme
MIRSELWQRIRFWATVDRLGPDIPWTHWRLYLRSTMQAICTTKFAYFGKDAEFRPGAYAIACSSISIGDRVVVRPGCMLFGDKRLGCVVIVIDDHVMMGSCVHIYTGNHRFEDPDKHIIDQGHSDPMPVHLREGCWIGAGAIILPGVTVGRNAVVGAGAVVTRDVADFTLVAGNPARVIRRTDDVRCMEGASRP